MDRRRISIIGSVAIVAVLLVSIGIAIGSNRADSAVAVPIATDDVPSVNGAAAAAGEIITALLDGDNLADPNGAVQLEDLLTPELWAEWTDTIAPAAAEVIEPLGGELAFAGQLAALHTWPMSTTVDAYNGVTATVQVWTLSIGESWMKPDAPRILGWRTGTIDLAWDLDHWVATAIAFKGGPVPGGAAQEPSPPSVVVKAMRGRIGEP